MKENLIASLAIVATFFNLIRYVPQAIKSIKEGFVGLSLQSWVLGFLEITAWAIWAIVAEQWLAGASYFILSPVTGWFVIKIYLAQHKKSQHGTYDLGDNGIPVP